MFSTFFHNVSICNNISKHSKLPKNGRFHFRILQTLFRMPSEHSKASNIKKNALCYINVSKRTFLPLKKKQCRLQMYPLLISDSPYILPYHKSTLSSVALYVAFMVTTLTAHLYTSEHFKWAFLLQKVLIAHSYCL